VDRPVLQAPSEQAAAGTILVHQQVNGEILDEEARPMLQALLIQRVEDGVAGAIRGSAGATSMNRSSAATIRNGASVSR
jgi:hypothetical protein